MAVEIVVDVEERADIAPDTSDRSSLRRMIAECVAKRNDAGPHRLVFFCHSLDRTVPRTDIDILAILNP